MLCLECCPLYLQSVSSTSRKRKREVPWEHVVEELSRRHSLTIEKTELTRSLLCHTDDAGDFHAMKKPVQEAICEACGITSWADAIVQVCETMVSQLLD
jgi:hypothetical protein